MGYRGRFFAIGVVCIFNIVRYFYYHQYLGLRFEASFFILTVIFLLIAWWCGKQFDFVKYYSEKDPLTGTYNRRFVEQSFEKLALVCRKENKRLEVIMIDLDDFKEINDTYGHGKGDELLQRVASVLRGIISEKDFIARWGGDEFVLFISKYEENHKSNTIELLKKQFININISISIGLATYPDEGESFEELIQLADERMYEMKALK